jgi:hypothetical protein
MTRVRHAFLFAAAVALTATLAVAADRSGHFLSGFEDLPLMDGLVEQTDSGVVFDKPDGRIVERYASGPLSLDSVKAFYSETLPQLGWQAKPAKGAGHLDFEREGEALDIEFKTVDSELVVRFSVMPD